ncbi:GTPase domain-containing protein [Roseobacter ponti]|uniref:G domain-containing protein n=1 Tax=Roseobacter ponti TaxID=1891787 RepID=A0A858SUH2_9RHOB|nr:GTPase domain-containing protein [Roseobacter ponti]QJF51161.1 hypothetical protein G3256_08310 [Roseobacter ponti]
MNALADTRNLTEMLADAMQANRMTGTARDTGERLLEHLRRPTVIVVAGLAGGGKTSLINMLAGTDLMPSLGAVPITELTWGETPKVVTELHNGEMVTFDGAPDAAELSSDVLRVSIETPSEILRDRSFIEVSLPDQQDKAEDFLDWGLERADVALWCTQNFDDREYMLWASAPDHLKDRSFLALTKADQLHVKGVLTRRLKDLDARAAEEFYGLYPVATLQALAARKTATDANPSLLTASGGSALMEGLEHQIAAGRMADMDHARILLDRAGVAQAPAKSPVPDPDLTAVVTSTAEPADPAEACGQALALIDRLAGDLRPAEGYLPGPQASRVLSACAQCASDVALLLESTACDSPAFTALRDEVTDAEQLITLLSTESGAAAATDALALMVQMRKEIHAETM